MSDIEYYKIIDEELKTNNVDSVLWLQAKALAEGNQDKTEAAYIKLRIADLRKRRLMQHNGSLNTQETDLSKIRSDLAKRLLMQGKKSLYSILNLHPDATDSLIVAAIADIESKDIGNSIVSFAEFKYAKDTLCNSELREQYDRQLLNSLIVSGRHVSSSLYEEDEDHSWWESSKTSVIIGVLSIALVGYLGLGYWKEKNISNVQNDIVDLQKEVTQNTTDIEQTRLQAEIDIKQRMLSLQEERQKQDLEIRARSTDQALDQQRAMQEARANAEYQRQETEQKRQQMLKEQAEIQRIAREKQYYVCLNQQLGAQLSRGSGLTADAYARCAAYKR